MSMTSFSDDWMATLTVRQAYLAMYSFLEEYYKLTHADEIGAMLGGLSLLPDDVPADPGFRQDWFAAVRKVLSADSSSYTGARLQLKKE